MPPDRAVAPAAGDDARNQQQQQGPGLVTTAIRMLLFYFFARNVIGGFLGKAKQPAFDEAGLPLKPTHYSPALASGTPLSMWAYLSESDQLDVSSAQLVWHETDVVLGKIPERTKTVLYHTSKAVQNNGSLYLHVALKEEGAADGSGMWSRSWPVNKYLPRPKVAQGVNLLSGKNDAGEQRTQAEQAAAAAAPREIISFLKPNISIAIVDDRSEYAVGQLVPQQATWMLLDDDSMTYQPTVFFNDFWLMRKHLVPVNETVTELPLHLSLSGMGNWKFMLYVQMDQSFNMQTKMGAMVEGDQDEFKRVLTEGNPLLLGLTFVVSLLHSVFDMLAFKNDIGFWKNKKSMEGLSIKSIFINAFCQLVILLYLLDNNTSFIILASSAVGLAIEFWKITKAMHVTLDTSGSIPRLRFRNRETYMSSKTAEYDDQAMKYLSWVLYPLVVGYGVYSLIYEPHKSWYSWLLNSLVGAVYTFGFILMCPQLYLNYKLKSVAHLPWRQMTYKFLNTIVDDLGAFVIKMPTLHRLAVFRDDLIFLIFLYQRYIYPIDKKRPNEFGPVTMKKRSRDAALDDRRRFVAEPTEEDLAAQAAESTGVTDASTATPALVEGTVIEELSGDSDGFEDLGKDKDAIKLRQRRVASAGASDGASTATAVDAPSLATEEVGKKGQ